MADTEIHHGIRFPSCTERLGLRWRIAALAAACLIFATSPSAAETFEEHFNGPTPSWQVMSPDSHAKTATHRRSREHGADGNGEQLIVETDRQNQTVSVVHVLPKARVLNELEVGVWVRTESPGVRVHLQILLPELKNPDTGRMLTLTIPGDVAEDTGDWQRITCRTDDEVVQRRLSLKMAKLHLKATPKQKLVDRVILSWPLSPGANELSLDELTFGPLVRVEDEDVSPIHHEQEAAETPPVQFRLGRMEFESKPVFLRMMAHHGEPLKDVTAAGINVLWIPDHTDRALLKSVREAGLWAAATPPQAVGTDGDPGDAGLLPFNASSRSIAFWMLGTRISPQSQHRLVKWVDQIHEADQKYGRPLAADVNGEEGVFSREVDLLGISRHTMASSLTLSDYRNWLEDRRSRARPGSNCWTWIQVMPSPAVTGVWQQHQIPLQLEPEQIRLEVFAALAAGMRGLGFWTTRALNEEHAADRETLLALRQINWELALIEPWLATTNSLFRIPVTIGTGDAGKAAAKQSSRLKLQRSKKRGQFQPEDPAEDEPAEQVEVQSIPELSTAVLKTDFGTLLLPMWLEANAQFVPGALAVNAITMVVPGVEETATAWEITTTGIQNLKPQRVSGGMKVTLKNFDQTACILLTSDRELIEDVKLRVAELQERSARNLLAMADLKLQRVREIDQQLGELGLRQQNAPHYLGEAQRFYTEGREALSQQEWNRTRLLSQQVMQMARTLQRAHWDDAVRELSSPAASPYAISFNSLPAQARLAMQLADAPAGTAQNLLPSGNFEDASVPLTAIGWKHEQHANDQVQAEADLNFEPYRGKYCLRLRTKAVPSKSPNTAPVGREFVTVTTPPVTVHAGHVLRVGGWIKVPAEIAETQDGAMIYDSLVGRNGALRFRAASGWQRFELVREVVESQDATVTLTLAGLGEVSFDDLEISVIPVSNVAQASGRESSAEPRPAPALSRWSDLRRLNPLPPRRNRSKPAP